MRFNRPSCDLVACLRKLVSLFLCGPLQTSENGVFRGAAPKKGGLGPVLSLPKGSPPDSKPPFWLGRGQGMVEKRIF